MTGEQEGMPEGLTVYSLLNAQAALESHALECGLPWALIKKPFLEFVAELRAEGFFILEAADQSTANYIQESLMSKRKSLELTLKDGLTVLQHDSARRFIEGKAALKFQASWPLAQAAVMKFLAQLYVNNVFVGAAQPQAAEFLRTRTEDQKNIYLRINKPAVQENSHAANP